MAKLMPVQNMIDQILADWGRIDILVNNAAVRPQFPLLEFDAWDWQRTLEVNLNGAFYATQLVGKAMRQQGGGAILNIAASLDAGRSGPPDSGAPIRLLRQQARAARPDPRRRRGAGGLPYPGERHLPGRAAARPVRRRRASRCRGGAGARICAVPAAAGLTGQVIEMGAEL